LSYSPCVPPSCRRAGLVYASTAPVVRLPAGQNGGGRVADNSCSTLGMVARTE